LAFAPIFLIADLANASPVEEARAELQEAEALVASLTLEDELAGLFVLSTSELLLISEQQSNLANEEVADKTFVADNAQEAYDNNLITEIIYTDSNLTATVYNNLGFNASPPIPGDNRIFSVQEVSNIDFQWGSGSVLGGPAEDVVVRFQGTITAETAGEYLFYGPADDGFILKINGTTIINDWVDKGGGGTVSQPVMLTAGESNTFEAWYYENGGGAWVQLYWSVNGHWQIVPPQAFDTVTTVQGKDPSLLVALDLAKANLAMSLEQQEIAQLNLSQAIENYNLSLQNKQDISLDLQEALQAIPALQQALADAIEASKPTPSPTPSETAAPEPSTEPESPEEPITPPAPLEPPTEPPVEPEQPVEQPLVMLENGVVVTQEVAESLLAFEENPLGLITNMFVDPGQTLKTIFNIGADMTPEVRERSEEVVIAAVIVGQIAQLASASALSSVRRI
jgi:hypothetical protein